MWERVSWDEALDDIAEAAAHGKEPSHGANRSFSVREPEAAKGWFTPNDG